MKTTLTTRNYGIPPRTGDQALKDVHELYNLLKPLTVTVPPWINPRLDGRPAHVSGQGGGAPHIEFPISYPPYGHILAHLAADTTIEAVRKFVELYELTSGVASAIFFPPKRSKQGRGHSFRFDLRSEEHVMNWQCRSSLPTNQNRTVAKDPARSTVTVKIRRQQQ